MKPHLALLGALLAAACASRTSPDAAATAAVRAPAFPHASHVGVDLACEACHAGIAEATALDPARRHVSLPAQPSRADACRGCHDTDPAARPAERGAFRVRIDHARHLGRVKDCRRCHRDLPEAGAREVVAPPMAACTGCHEHQEDYAAARCAPCHVDLKGRSPETAFAHTRSWRRAHGDPARTAAETCAQCHDAAYCASCHATQTAPALPERLYPERVERAFIHRGDYLGRHAIDATARPASCRRCHGSASCEACHAQQGVAAGAAGAAEPHPGGWLAAHGRAARRDVSRCAACHDDGAAAVCVGCHRVGGSGGNPHPVSFTRKHRADDAKHDAMCRTCHAP